MPARRIILLSALCLSVAAGCRPGPAGDTSQRPGPLGLFSRDRLNDEIQTPPGIAADQIEPLQGDGLDRARRSLKKVLAAQQRPAYLDAPPDDEPDARPAEPPLAAQLAYMKARTAWREGNATEAKKQFEAALRLAPNEPTILRLLGEVYSRTGNRVKGAHYFRQAVDIDPDDARSVFILGRFAIEKGDDGEAIVLFHDAIGKAGDDPALNELGHHFLGNALRSTGYIDASIGQFERYIDLMAEPIKPSRFARDQALLRRQIGVTFQLLGDLNLRMDRPEPALQAYDLALAAGVPDPVKLDKRRTYAALLARDAGLARDLVIEQVRRQRGDAQSLAMVRYAVNQGVDAAGLASAIRTVYDSEARPPELAIASADVMTTDEARGLLIDHLNEHPADAVVFQRLLRYYLLPVDRAPHSDRSLAEAADLTAGWMARAPSNADEYGSSLVTHAPDAEALLAVIERSAGGDPPDTMRTVLRGLCLAVIGRFDEARTFFEAAVEAEPGLLVARIELAKALIVQDEFDLAAETLEPLSDSNETGVILLRLRVMAETNRVEEAIDLIDRVIGLAGGDTKLVLTKANLEIRLGRIEEAEQTLQDALNAQPTAEPLYEALLNLYDPAPGRASAIKDQTAKWRVLVKRLLGTIPNSRTGRLVQAQLHDASRNYDRAAAILEGLLAENPDDPKALTQLLDTYHAAGRTGEAIAMLESRLEARPDDALLLQIAQRFYRQARDQDRLFDVQERLLMLEPDTPERAGRLGYLYAQWGKHERAVQVLEAAVAGDDVPNPAAMVNLLASSLIELGELDEAERRILEAADRFPEQTVELKYLLSIKIIARGDQARGERVMRDILADHPDHGPTNNGLGYAMLMRNEDPEAAVVLIQRAVDSEPGNEAYMDSLGWGYYKLGRFEDAEVWLRKAKDAAIVRLRNAPGSGSATLAVINDHLGDTLYRLGREPEALRSWTEAAAHLRSVSAEDKKLDPELASMTQRLGDKIRAVRAKEPVPVADLPGPAEDPTDPPAPAPAADPPPAPEAAQAGDADR